MRGKKAKLLRRIARGICSKSGKLQDVPKEYKRLKKIYKQSKGEI